MEISVCRTDEDYEAWRAVRIAVIPNERTDTVAELRAQDSATRVFLLARKQGVVVGSGMADKSETAGGGFAAPRVLPEHRRQGVGTALLHAMADHCVALGLPELRSGVDDEGSLAFAERFGFVEVDRQVEQLRAVGDEPSPATPPDGVDIVLLSERPELWAACYEGFGREVLADFALFQPLEVSAEQWNAYWAGDPMFLAVHDGEVVGCAGLHLDTDRPERAENALTAVRRSWRGRGLASYLKRHTLHWAATHGIDEVYTWTQAGNTSMLTLNDSSDTPTEPSASRSADPSRSRSDAPSGQWTSRAGLYRDPVTSWLQVGLTALSVAVGVLALWYVVRDRRADRTLLAAIGILWLGTLVQLGYGIVRLDGHGSRRPRGGVRAVPRGPGRRASARGLVGGRGAEPRGQRRGRGGRAARTLPAAAPRRDRCWRRRQSHSLR